MGDNRGRSASEILDEAAREAALLVADYSRRGDAIPRNGLVKLKAALAILDRTGHGPHSAVDVDANVVRPFENMSTEDLLEIVKAARGGSGE